MRNSRLHIGVRKGGGPPPGYRWSVLIVDFVYDEAMKFLDTGQYSHLAEQFRELAGHAEPSASLTVSVQAIEDFHELKDKGGPLGKTNVRIFYYIDRRVGARAIVIVGAFAKQNDGKTPDAVKIRIRRRVKAYLRGEYGQVGPSRRRNQVSAAHGSEGESEGETG